MTRVKILGTKDFDTKFKAKGNFQVDLPPSTYPFPLKPKTVKKYVLIHIYYVYIYRLGACVTCGKSTFISLWNSRKHLALPLAIIFLMLALNLLIWYSVLISGLNNYLIIYDLNISSSWLSLVVCYLQSFFQYYNIVIIIY